MEKIKRESLIVWLVALAMIGVIALYLFATVYLLTGTFNKAGSGRTNIELPLYDLEEPYTK